MTAASKQQARWDDIQRSITRRLSRRLFDDVARQPIHAARKRSWRPGWSLSLAYLMTALVYLVSVGFAVAGIVVLLRPWTNLFVVVGGMALLLLCFITRPRLSPAPDRPLAARDFPFLFSLTERIARAMGAPPVHGIGVSADFGANYRISGWRRKRYMELGAPFMAVLTPAERVAVIVHELSHGANRDPLRGQLLHGAVHTLLAWSAVLRPAAVGRAGDGAAFGPLVSLAAIPLELALLAVSELLVLVAQGFLLLIFRQSQRAEYFADLLAATVAGSNPMREALAKTYLFDTVDTAVQRQALTRPHDPVAPELAKAMEGLDPAAWERLKSQARAEQAQVDSTHPPTAMRIDMLTAQAQHECSVVLSNEELERFDQEILKLLTLVQREMVNRKLEAMHG